MMNNLITNPPSFEEVSSVIADMKKKVREGKIIGQEKKDDESLVPIVINPDTTKFLILYNITSGNPDLINNKNFDITEKIMQSPALSRAFNSEGKYVQMYDKNASTTDETQYTQMMDGMYSFFLKYYTFLYENRLNENDMTLAEKKLKKYLIDVSKLSENEKLLGKEVIMRDVSSTVKGIGGAFISVISVFLTQFVIQHLSNYIGSKTSVAQGEMVGPSIIPFVKVLGASGVGYVLLPYLPWAVGLIGGPATAVTLAGTAAYYAYKSF